MQPTIQEVADCTTDERRHNQLKRQTPRDRECLGTLRQVVPGFSGGINRLLDPEIAYIRLRDEDPSLIAALMRSDTMTIPAGEAAGGRLRPDNAGPVVFVDPRSGALGMRFTARRRNVSWRDDPVTQRAVRSLLAVLRDDPLIVETRLAAGQGVICNNVLHDRSAFSGGSRLLYRVRYKDRVDGSGALS